MDDILTQTGMSVELPASQAIIREVESRCKKCGHVCGSFLPWEKFKAMSRKEQKQYLKKTGECNHKWEDIVIREYDALDPVARLPRI